MRIAVLVVVVLAACGASATEIRRAQTATYEASPTRGLQAALEATNELYGVGAVDAQHFTFVTKSFFTKQPMSHRGWAAEWARGGWIISVHTTQSGHTFVVITPHAQRSLTTCKRRCAPTPYSSFAASSAACRTRVGLAS